LYIQARPAPGNSGQTISEAFTIKGVEVALGASVGIDAKGFYIEVQPGKDVKGARLYFKN
jgi:hypothetical protein